MNVSIAVLISGRGSNLRAILESPTGEHVSAVISDNPQAAGLQTAKAHGKTVHIVAPKEFTSTEEWASQLLAVLREVNPKLVALAGFMRVLPPSVVRAYSGRMINIHPSLLPQFRGLDTHARALAASVAEHGCTVHYVDEGVDTGEIIAQAKVNVLPDDDEDSLAARVLKEEHQLYPKIISQLLAQLAKGENK